MPDSAPERSTLRALDAQALDRVLRRLQQAAQPPWLHGEVARRMAERLPIMRMQPQQVLNWGAFVGASGQVLRQSYPRARLLSVEASGLRPDPAAAARRPSRWAAWQPWRSRADATPVLNPDQVAPGEAQLVWSNMGLHGAIDPRAVMSAWHRALQVDGFLMFSTLGPGTLQQLTQLYRDRGWPPAMAPLVDMHDLGDMLLSAGFADPVMDQETLTLTWADPESLLLELRQLGGNVDPRRWPALRTPRWRRQLGEALAGIAGSDGRIALDFELVYGHAFRPAPRHKLAARTEVPLQDMRDLVRRRKP